MDNTKDLIFAVFNLRVIARQERQVTDVRGASNYFYDVFYTHYYGQYEGLIDDVLITYYSDYLTSIALLGYILPYVCTYDDGFKIKLINLILTKVKKPREVIEFEELQKQKAPTNREKPSLVEIY